MKTFFLILLFIHITKSASEVRIIECKKGCREGPIRLPYYICQCPLTANPELSICIQKCVNDVVCRFCYGDVHLGLPPLCPLVIKQEIDLSGKHFDFIFKCGTKIFGLDRGKGTDLIFFDPVTRFGHANLIVDKLTIEGKYKIAGKFCDEKPVKSEGYLKITFENLIVDWYPQIDVVLKCNVPYFFINGPKSNLSLSTDKRVKFEFKEYKKNDCKLSECVNDKWDEVLGKIIIQLQQFFNVALSEFSNIILLQVPVYNVFKIGSVTPLTSVGIPQGQIPLPQGSIPLPITIPGDLLPGGALPGGNQIGGLPIVNNATLGGSVLSGIPFLGNIPIGSANGLSNLGLAPDSIFINNNQITSGNTLAASSNDVTKKPVLENLIPGLIPSNVFP